MLRIYQNKTTDIGVLKNRSLIFLLFILSAVFSLQLTAQNYIVNSNIDAVAVNLVTGETATPGQITLRSAIQAATAQPGAHIITFSGAVVSPINLSLGQITLGNAANGNNITITGPGMNLLTVNQTTENRIFSTGTGAVTILLQDITFNYAGPAVTPYSGGGGAIIAGGAGAASTFINCRFTNFQRQIGNGGAISQSSSLTSHNLTITNCIFTNNRAGGAGGAVSFNSQGGTATITGCTFENNRTGVVGANTGGDGGAVSVTGGGSGGTYLIERNTFLNNQVENVTGHAGAVMNTNGTLTLRFNRFIGNTCANTSFPPLANIVGQAGGASTHVTIADNNWWGVNTGPGTNDATALAAGAVMTLTKWLQLKTTASPNPICNTPAGLGNTTTVTTSFLSNSANEAIALGNLTTVIGLPVVWGPTTLGSLSGQQSSIQASGTATALFTSNGTGGTATVNTQVDNIPAGETTPARANITVNTLPTVTNPANTMACVGSTATFTSTITGVPAPTIVWRIGATPLVNGIQGSGSTVSGQGTNTLTITNVQAGDASPNYNVQASNPCGLAASADATLTVNSVTGGTVGSNQLFCAPADPAAFTESVASSGSGTLTYQWESSTTSCAAGFSPIGGATATTYDAPAGLTQTTYYRRVTTSTLAGFPCTANSNCITVNVNAVTGGTVAASQAICTPADPAAFTESVASTGAGVLTYQWESSTTSCAVGFGPIGGATATTYDAPAGLTQTTYYRRVTTSTLLGLPCTANSNCLIVTVNPTNTVTLTSAAGTDNQTVVVLNPITNITYATTGATGATVTGLPAGVTGSWVANVATISGTPTVTGTFNYTVTLTGGCGTITATGTITVIACATNTWAGTVSNNWFAAANWSCGVVPTSPMDVVIASGTPFPCVISAGTAQVNDFTINAGAIFTNNGTLNINGGGVVTTAGTYRGTGTFTGAVYNNTGGIVSPGLSPGCTVFGAGYTNGTGTEIIEIGGTTVCTQYDQLQVVGTATLSGTLDVQLFGGFIPSCGQSFKIMTSNTLVGTFATILYPALPAGLSWGIQYNLPNPGDVTLNILGTPTATATPASQTVCSAAPITTIVLSGSPIAGTVYNWTRDNTGTVTGIAASGSGDISGTLTNLTNIPITVTFTITPVSGLCTGAAITATVTVSPTPDVNQPANQVVCNGAPTTAVTFTGSVTAPPGTVFNWTNTDPSIGLAASGSGNIASFTATNATAAPVVATVTVTPSYTIGGGPGGPVTFTNAANIVLPDGNATTYPSSIVVSGLAVTGVSVQSITLTNIQHTWSADVDVLLVAPGGQHFALMTDVGGSEGFDAVATVTIRDGFPLMPLVTAAIPSGTYAPTSNTVSSAGNIGGVWSAPAPAGPYNYATPLGSSTFASVFNTTTDYNGSWSLFINDDAAGDVGNIAGGWSITLLPPAGTTCNGTPRTFTYTVNPTPVASITPAGPVTICQGSSVTLTASATCNSFAFSGLMSGAQEVPANASTARAVFNGTFNASTNQLTLNVVFDGLTGGPASAAHVHNAAVGVNGPVIIPLTAFPAATSSSYSNTFTVPAAQVANLLAGNTYINIHNAGFPGGELRGQITNLATNVFTYAGAVSGAQEVPANGSTATGNFAGTYNNNTSQLTLNLIFNNLTGGNATAAHVHNAAVGVNGPVIIPLAGFPAATSGSYSNVFTMPAAQVANFLAGNTYINIHNGGFPGGEVRGQIAAPAAVCTGVTYLWSPGGQTTQAITVSTANTYSVTATVNGCNSAPASVVVNVNPIPTVNAVANQIVCNGAPTTAVNFTGTPVGVVFNWTNTDPSIGLAASGTGNIASFTATNAGTAPVTATITVTPTYTNGGVTCTGTAITFTYTVNPTPTAVATPASQTICSATAITTIAITGNAVAGVVYNWTRDNVATVTGIAASGAGNISGTLTNTTNTPITVTFTITPTANGCSGTPITATVLVNPTATVNPVANQVVCNGSPTTAVNFTSPTTGGSIVYDWTNNTTSIGLAASGTGDIASFTATNNTNAPVTATITVTPTYTNGGISCVGTPFSFTITVNPTPIIDPVPNQVVCNNGATNAVNFTTPTTGGTAVYNWTNNNISIGLAAAGTGNIASFTATNPGNAPVTATVTVNMTYTSGGTSCVSLPISFTITVNPTPVVDQPASQVVCAGALTTPVNFTSPTTGGTLTYNWTNSQPSIGLAASGSGNIAAFTAINNTTAPIIAVITVTPTFTNGGVSCTGSPKTFTITVNPTPTVNPVANQVVCNNSATITVVFSGNVPGTVYNWTNNTTSIGLGASGTGDIPSFIATNATNAPVTATITVTPTYTNGGVTCTGTPTSFTITVNPTPIVNPVANQLVCNNSPTVAINFTSPTTGGTIVYNWTNTNSAIGLGPNGTGNIPSFTALNPGVTPIVATITVIPVFTNAGVSCNGTPVTFTITVNPTPTVNQPANQVVCNGVTTAPVIFTGAVAGTVYNWTNNNTSIGLAASGTGNIAAFTAINTGVTVQVATITVTPSYTNGGVTCTGTPVSFTITVNPTPTVNQPANQTVCAGATVTVNFTGTVTGTVYNWTNSNPAIGLGAAGTGNISFVATNTGALDISGTITVTPTFTNGGVTCTGTPVTFTITVNPTPKLDGPPPGNQLLCNGSPTAPINFTTTMPGVFFQWTNNQPSIGLASAGAGNIPSFIATNTGAAPVTATVTVTPRSTLTTCVGVPFTFTITVNPTPSVNAIANQVLCNGATTTAVTITGTVPGTVYNWTNNNISIGLAASGTATVPAFTAINNTNAPVTATITVTPTYTNAGLSCVGTPVSFTITVNPMATVNQPANQVLCNGSNTTDIVFTGAPAGSTYNWTNNNTSIGLAASGSGNIASFTAINTGNAPVTATITVTPTATGCGGTPVSFTITVNPTPAVNAIASQTVCAGTATTAVTISGPVAGTVYTWTNNNTTIGLGASGLGNIPAFVTINPTINPVTATITVTPTYTNAGVSCTGAPVSFTITVNPRPNIIFSNVPPRVCLTDTLVNLNGKVSPAGGSWSGNGVTGSTFSAVAAGLGVHVLSYTITNTNGCNAIAYFSITVNDCIDRHNVFATAIRIYPNPNSGQFNIRFNSDIYTSFNVRVIDGTGRVYRTLTFSNLRYGSVIPMNLPELAAGMYFLQVYNENERAEFPLVIVR